MSKLAGLLLCLAVVGVASFAHSAAPISPPLGVDVQNWIPVSEHLGFVATHGNVESGFPSPVQGAVEGYFVVRKGNSWLRVSHNQLDKFVPANGH